MKWRLICKVQSERGITEPTVQGDETIEAETPIAALVLWLCGKSYKDAWLRCDSVDCSMLMRHNAADNNPLAGERFEASGDTWDADCIEFGDDYVDMTGTHCDGEYHYAVTVRQVSLEEIARLRVLDVDDLSLEALKEIVEHARDGLFLDLVDDQEVYSLDKPVSGADYIQHMTDVLNKHGMVPERED